MTRFTCQWLLSDYSAGESKAQRKNPQSFYGLIFYCSETIHKTIIFHSWWKRTTIWHQANTETCAPPGQHDVTNKSLLKYLFNMFTCIMQFNHCETPPLYHMTALCSEIIGKWLLKKEMITFWDADGSHLYIECSKSISCCFLPHYDLYNLLPRNGS